MSKWEQDVSIKMENGDIVVTTQMIMMMTTKQYWHKYNVKQHCKKNSMILFVTC